MLHILIVLEELPNEFEDLPVIHLILISHGTVLLSWTQRDFPENVPKYHLLYYVIQNNSKFIKCSSQVGKYEMKRRKQAQQKNWFHLHLILFKEFSRTR